VRLGFSIGYAPPGTNPTELIALAREAERLGFDSAWAAEAWGTDAVSVLAWLGASTSRIGLGSAVMQIAARSPAATAMTAATLDLMSGGRFRLGLGVSGPQVVEGWHGQPWARPLVRTREYVEIVRAALRRERLEYDGAHYRIPYRGPGETGLGKPLKLMLRPVRTDLPIYLAALRPRAVALAVEVADGWLPFFFVPNRARDVFGATLDRARNGFDIAPTAPVVLTDHVQAGLDALKPFYALYVGGMGAREQNFYNELMGRYGYPDEARQVQELYLAGRQRDAAAAVPDRFVDGAALVGPRERLAERVETWREAGVTTLICATRQVEALQALAELVL
jgi:F420-dependent oxidoreductase-like protein